MFSFLESDREKGRMAEVDVCGHLGGASARMAESVDEAVWVFGYGSLCWFPGFEYKDSVLGCVTGFKRRFWQGNATHRGTAVKPGRVATVVEEKKGVVWGRAFLVTGDAALPYLNQRECKLGGYATRHVLFHPAATTSTSHRTSTRLPTRGAAPETPSPTKEDLFTRGLLANLRLEREVGKDRSSPYSPEGSPELGHRRSSNCTSSPLSITRRLFGPGGGESGIYFPDDACEEERDLRTSPFPAMMYVATEENRHWLGKAPLHSIAEQIAECHGPSGSNADYLLNLARFMRTELPSARDDHLFELERLVRERMALRGQRALAVEAGAGREETAQQYTSRLPSKKLRCLNI